MAADARARLVAFLPLAALVLLAAVFLRLLVSDRDPARIPPALVGKPAPTLDLPPLAGLTRNGAPVPPASDAQRAGRTTLVNVWASWCVPCRREHPLLMALARGGRVNLVGIDYKDEPRNALRFLDELGNPYDAVGVDPTGVAAIDWGVYGIPETFLVDAEGLIVFKHVGPLTPEALRGELLPAIARALGEG